jgi:hypothetical protein
MKERKTILSVGLQIISSIGLLILSSIIGIFFFPIAIHDFLINILGYQRPTGFFGFTFADWDVAWILASCLWTGIILGGIGRKVDYIFIFLFFLLTSVEFFYTENMTLTVYLALVGVTVLGNLIGFAIKVLRKKYW